MLKIAIIGCGKIADAHLEQIQHIPGCRVVGACDREPLMARQLCERFEIPHAFSEVDQLLKEVRPDVVHITTPPQSHYPLARECLEAGANVYVEKPFTLNLRDAEQLIDLANSKNLKVTAGHDLQFTHVARRLRQLVREGYLGGEALHMESYYCYDLSDPVYARALLGDKHHWVRRLPGKLLHNIISHGIARIAEFFPNDDPVVLAHGFTSSVLRNLGETDIIDELRVTISDQRRSTAYFTFSSQMRPSLNSFRIFGAKNGLALDQDQESLLKLRGGHFKSYVEKFLPQGIMAKQYAQSSIRNMRLFLARDFHMKAGMRNLIGSFYSSIAANTPLPIPYREILLTCRIMDHIFAQLNCLNSASQPMKGRSQTESAVQPETADVGFYSRGVIQ
jgi:predicted dehydrogenase